MKIKKLILSRALLAGFALGALTTGLAAHAKPMTHAQRAPAGIEGVVRVSGPPEMTALLQRWQDGFRKANPMAEFEDRLKGRNSAVYGIEMRTADIALLDRPINPFERYGTYEHSWIFPVEIEVATDGLSRAVEPSTEAVFVAKDSPLTRLTIAQLDGIFGGARDGGFDKLDWNTHAARTAAADIRTWGQLGLTGERAGAAIHPYGPASHGNGVITHFQNVVLQGGAMRNEDLREYDDPAAMFRAMAQDPLAIGYGPLAAMPAGFKALALAPREGGAYALPTAANLADRAYPLAKPIYLYFTIDTTSGQLADPRVDPKIKAFVSYILSPAGQAAVRADGHYLPLTPTLAKRALDILNSQAHPPERPM